MTHEPVGGVRRRDADGPESAAANRSWWDAEAPDYYASSDVQLDGVDAAATHQFTWKELPGGAYRVEAILLREDGHKETYTSCFAVLGADDTPSDGAAAARRLPAPQAGTGSC